MSRYNGLIITLLLRARICCAQGLFAMSVPNAFRLTALAATCAALSACSTLNNATSRIGGLVSPYKIEVVQGNFVSKEQKDALQIGMPPAQVRDILGSPLVTSAFHSDRWEYVFNIRRQGSEPQQRKLTVFFNGETLAKVESDELISEEAFVASLSVGRSLGKVPLLEVPAEVLREFGLKNSAPSTAVAGVNTAQVATNTGATRNFPPLEAPGAVTSAWDASTQRAVAASTASRVSAAPAAPLLTAQAPVLSTAPRPAAAPSPAPAVAPATSAAPTPASAVVIAPVLISQSPAGVNPMPAPSQAAAPATLVVPAGVAPAVAVSPAPSQAAPAAPRAVPPAPAAPVVAPAAVVSPVPVQAAPAPLPPPQVLPSASTLASADPEITTFLNRWTSDWQSRNAAAYFAHYMPEFKGTSNSRAEWEALRRTRIEGGTRISLAALDVRVRMVSPTEARLVFRQNYESDAFSEIGTKAMFLVKRDGRWLIEREFFTPLQ